jgi:arabinoxylan arabinofuranohydrolase
MVAPVKVECDEKSVADGGKVVIRAYDPYSEDNTWTAKASDGNEYTGAEVTSEGFHIFGLDPYKYYSAGYACYLSDPGIMQDSWDIWDNSMLLTNVKNDNIVGFKYFGFGGLDKAQKGLKPFEGTKPGNNTAFNLFLTPKTAEAFKINVWIDGPWDNDTWNGTKIGEINVPANSAQEITKFTLDVASVVDKLDGKHAIYLVVEGPQSAGLCDFVGLGFSSKKKELVRPVPPNVIIAVNGTSIELPSNPVRFTSANGIAGYDLYEAKYTVPAGTSGIPTVTASADNSSVKVDIEQAVSKDGTAVVKFDYLGVVKTYRVVFSAN